MNATYVSRVLRLTLLAPEILEVILNGWQPVELRLANLLEEVTLDWDGCSLLRRRSARPEARLWPPVALARRLRSRP